jgi:type II secretory ATPase GspE/PulE/Tfp pilus assembly ATPase PilB-like protein
MTGHLVLTTLHAQTAAAAIQRLLDISVDAGIISTSINCFVAQRLARRLCKDCAEPYQADQKELATIGVPEEYGDLQLFRAVGCPECGGIGYRGRVGLFEVMPMSDEISRLIGAPTREIEAEAVRNGMFTMRDDGIRLSMAGLTTLDEVRRVAGDRASLSQ